MWFSTSIQDTSQYLYLYSNCGDKEFALYRTIYGETSFEEVTLPHFEENENPENLRIVFSNKILVMYLTSSGSCWIVRSHLFEFAQPLNLLSLVRNEEFKEDGFIKQVSFSPLGELHIELKNEKLDMEIFLGLLVNLNYFTANPVDQNYFNKLDTVNIYKEFAKGMNCSIMQPRLRFKSTPFGSGHITTSFCAVPE